MLILRRKLGEAIRIGDMRVVITRIKGGNVYVGIEAPREVPVWCEEYDKCPPLATTTASPR